MSNPDRKRAKVMFQIEQKDGYPPVAVESMWAVKVGDGLYEIENIPFYAKGIGLGDIVGTTASETGSLVFDRVASSRGHSTLRLVFIEMRERKRIEKALEALGCGWEGGVEPSLISVDVPPAASFDEVLKLVSEACTQGILDYETAAIRHS
jgi:hypothetical protein